MIWRLPGPSLGPRVNLVRGDYMGSMALETHAHGLLSDLQFTVENWKSLRKRSFYLYLLSVTVVNWKRK